MENFTPLSALIGGVLIGLASTMFLWLNGRVAGISGIIGAPIPPARGDVRWRLLFAFGLVLGAAVYGVAAGADRVAIQLDASTPLLIVGGLLVGFGTRLGDGCTSGHGVCGIARLSPRSIVATAVFMAIAGVMVFVARHLIGG